MGAFERAAGAVLPVDSRAGDSARAHHDRLTKPRGALGRLEDIGVQLAAISGSVPPPVPEPATVAVFAGDHGVLEEEVSPWPAEVTAQMVANFCAGGAAINVLARQAGAEVVVVDVGVAAELEPAPGLVRAKVRRATANLARGPAMSPDEARRALDVGAEVAGSAVQRGARALVTGDMGIGNTTPSAALIAAFTGRPAAEVTGRGTGIDDAALARKTAIVGAAAGRVAPGTAPLEIMADLGGLEIAAIAGFIVAGAAARLPVVLDGVVAGAAALAAAALVPPCLGYLVAGHRSSEPGAAAALEHLGIEPVLDLEMRLGEGTGGCLALQVVQVGARVMAEMATFDSAGVTEKQL